MTTCGQPQPLINLPYAIPLLQYNPYLPWFPPSQLPPPNLTSGLPPVTNVGILPKPVPVKIEVPKIGTWLVYCDMHPDCKGDNFSQYADTFHEEGYHHINQLVGDHMDVEKLSRWLNIGKGTADLLIQYVEEDMVLVNTGSFSMVG
ncbi:hypothetical protein F5148DRAFT_1152061 [Russula earlei]|uniref:Uncharacterized protein n=1 Tax=Russula earlei TaxID=71964 RepID=A0ACC0TY24_9AGAM|nr:hypothetical protein F5148DRAFT_1152061 [Russula earlei]